MGILSVVAGIMALANPFAATLTAELLAGYMFTAIGVLTLISGVSGPGLGRAPSGGRPHSRGGPPPPPAAWRADHGVSAFNLIVSSA